MKSQMEIMGFAIIIMLTIFGLFVYLTWQQSEPTPNASLPDRGFAASLVGLLPKISTECGSLGTVIQECMWGVNYLACPQTVSCGFMIETLDKISKSIGENGLRKPHRLVILKDDGKPWEDKDWAYNCKKDSPRSAPAQEPLTLFPRASGRVVLSLALCQETPS